MTTETFQCECYSDEHVFKFIFNKPDNVLYLDVSINNYLPWYKRVWEAMKYIVCYTSKYGQFDTVLFRRVDAERLQTVLSQFIKPNPNIKEYRISIISDKTSTELTSLLKNNDIEVESIRID